MNISTFLLVTIGSVPELAAPAPTFTFQQRETFSSPGALCNAWADFDSDGDLDLAVSFDSGAIRLYRNDGGTFSVVTASGLPAEGPEFRGLSWGDFDADGDPDLYAGVSTDDGSARNMLFRNDGGRAFVEVGEALGVGLVHADTRQSNWIDYDNDGDLDLFVAQRWRENHLFRNEGHRFVDVSEQVNLADPRRTVGACWFDMDQDGDLDLFLANQQGDQDAMYRNDRNTFIDIAPQLQMHQPGRSIEEGGVGCTVGDYDNDGLLDLFVATYGSSLLYHNLGGGRFRETAKKMGMEGQRHAVGAAWGDADNDGRLDLFVTGYFYKGDDAYPQDRLFMNRGERFVDVLTEGSPLQVADHGVQWVDFDADGDLDLSLTNSFFPTGAHPVLRNELPAAQARNSLQVLVLDHKGRATRSGAEVRLYAPDGKLLGTRLVSTGDGYDTQSSGSVHFGLPNTASVDVEVTFLTPQGRKVQRLKNVDVRPAGGPVVVKAD